MVIGFIKNLRIIIGWFVTIDLLIRLHKSHYLWQLQDLTNIDWIAVIGSLSAWWWDAEIRDYSICPVCVKWFSLNEEIVQMPCNSFHLAHITCFEMQSRLKFTSSNCPICFKQVKKIVATPPKNIQTNFNPYNGYETSSSKHIWKSKWLKKSMKQNSNQTPVKKDTIK